MSHRTQTTVRHWLTLTEGEQFERKGYRKTPLRVESMTVSVVDGSISSVTLSGYPVLKSGELGKVHSQIGQFGKPDETVAAILRAHGIGSPS